MNRPKFHIAISTLDIERSIADYAFRLGEQPSFCVAGEYALWRTESLNVSVRRDDSCRAGTIRHLGWEDATACEFTQDTDINGIVWERFTAEHQADEINELWPDTNYQPSINKPISTGVDS